MQTIKLRMYIRLIKFTPLDDSLSIEREIRESSLGRGAEAISWIIYRY